MYTCVYVHIYICEYIYTCVYVYLFLHAKHMYIINRNYTSVYVCFIYVYLT